jgi:hypothetical protein
MSRNAGARAKPHRPPRPAIPSGVKKIDQYAGNQPLALIFPLDGKAKLRLSPNILFFALSFISMVEREFSINAMQENRATVALIEDRTSDKRPVRGRKRTAPPGCFRHFGLF